MEQNFQTSFIPKKPMIEERAIAPRPVGLLNVILIFTFFTVLLASGGLYFYKTSLAKKISAMETDLNLAKNRFEPARIASLQVLDKRLRASSEVLDNHVAITPIFEALQDITMKTVRYDKFSYTLEEGASPKMTVSLSGQAVGYRSVALQSDLFAENEQFIDPVFSNLALDDRGNVLFDLEFSVDPNFIDYKQMLQTESTGELNSLPQEGAMN